MTWTEQLRALKTDRKKWALILKNKKKVTVFLDNDCTYLYVNEDREQDTDAYEGVDFNEYLGASQGVVDLLLAVGIECEFV